MFDELFYSRHKQEWIAMWRQSCGVRCKSSRSPTLLRNRCTSKRALAYLLPKQRNSFGSQLQCRHLMPSKLKPRWLYNIIFSKFQKNSYFVYQYYACHVHAVPLDSVHINTVTFRGHKSVVYTTNFMTEIAIAVGSTSEKSDVMFQLFHQ